MPQTDPVARLHRQTAEMRDAIQKGQCRMPVFTDAETKAEALRQENDYLRELLARTRAPMQEFMAWEIRDRWKEEIHELQVEIEKAIGESDE